MIIHHRCDVIMYIYIYYWTYCEYGWHGCKYVYGGFLYSLCKYPKFKECATILSILIIYNIIILNDVIVLVMQCTTFYNSWYINVLSHHSICLMAAEWRMYASLNYAIICSDISESCIRHQDIFWINDGSLLIVPLITNPIEILITVQFLYNKMILKMQSAQWLPFCIVLNMLIYAFIHARYISIELHPMYHSTCGIMYSVNSSFMQHVIITEPMMLQSKCLIIWYLYFNRT